MKANLSTSYRGKMMLYTLLSIVITLCADFIAIYLFKKLHWQYHMMHNITTAETISNTSQNSLPKENTSINFNPDNFLFNGNRLFFDHFSVFFYVVLTILSVILFLLIFQLLTRKTVLYLQEITGALEKISEGDFETRLPVRYNDEFSMIADHINRMTMDLEFLKKGDLATEKKKNELITNVAHDLRTPLTSIIGYLDILNTHPELTKEKRKSYTQIAYNKAAKLQTLIEDLFSFTKITYGQMPFKLGKIDVVKLLEQEIEEFYPDFTDNHLNCDFKTEINTAPVMADSNLLARAFENLISNAIKYGKDGKVIRIRIIQNADNVSVSVTNYGIVIPKEDLPLIFDKFYRVEPSRQETLGGTGLGLSIAKAIIENHNGTIAAKSSLDGTVFEVSLPMITDDNIE